MEKESEKLSSIFQAMQDGIYIIRADYTVEFMNHAMIRNFGDGTGQKCYRLLNKSEETCPGCKAREVFQGATVRWERHIAHQNKTYYITELPFKDAEGTAYKISICRDITQRKLREERIQTSEQDYQRLFEHVGCGVYISSKEGHFLDANQALLKMLGYESKEEFLKVDIAKDVYLRPQDRKKFQDMVERDGQVIDYEVDFKRKDGSPVSILLNSHVRYDRQGNVLGYEGIMVDQTQRKKTEQELKEAHDFRNEVIHSSPNAIMVIDARGDLIIWNQAAEEIFGYRAADVIYRMNIEEIFPRGVRKKVMDLVRSPEHGGVGRLNPYPMELVNKRGEVVEGDLSATSIREVTGKEIAVIVRFVDLRERLKMERKLRDTQEQLLQSEKLAAMGRLTSQVAHELNNPLYGIMNTLELMKTEIAPGSKRRKILDMALSETVRLTDLLRKMLSFSKPDQEEKQPTDINSVLDEILLLHEKQLREHNIRILSSFSKDLGFVYASRNQLRQVFLNLIGNARDAMPEGGSLTVQTAAEGENILIEVSDTGTGIKEEHLDKIFDAFFTTKSGFKGVGLGLSVCYGFIKDHGGDIKVKSERGSGTTFTISLPLYHPG